MCLEEFFHFFPIFVKIVEFNSACVVWLKVMERIEIADGIGEDYFNVLTSLC